MHVITSWKRSWLYKDYLFMAEINVGRLRLYYCESIMCATWCNVEYGKWILTIGLTNERVRERKRVCDRFVYASFGVPADPGRSRQCGRLICHRVSWRCQHYRYTISPNMLQKLKELQWYLQLWRTVYLKIYARYNIHFGALIISILNDVS